MKCKKLLSRGGIDAQSVKIMDPDGAGCINGVEISESDMFSAAAMLRGAGINYKIYHGKEK